MDEFEQVAAQLPKSGTKSWYETTPFSDEERAKLDAALSNMQLSARVISVVLNRWGYKISPDQVSHYRRRRNE